MFEYHLLHLNSNLSATVDVTVLISSKLDCFGLTFFTFFNNFLDHTYVHIIIGGNRTRALMHITNPKNPQQ
jgi:hypothetical protein